MRQCAGFGGRRAWIAALGPYLHCSCSRKQCLATTSDEKKKTTLLRCILQCGYFRSQTPLVMPTIIMVNVAHWHLPWHVHVCDQVHLCCPKPSIAKSHALEITSNRCHHPLLRLRSQNVSITRETENGLGSKPISTRNLHSSQN